MTLTFPLSAADFFERFNVQHVSLRLKYSQEVSYAGGTPLFADIEPAGWVAECETVPIANGIVHGHMARMASLRGGIKSFFLYDTTLPYPQADPDGTILGSNNVTIQTVHDASSLTLTGLPVGYVLTEGDMFEVTYASPPRTYLGYVLETVTADAVGNAGPFNVAPFLPTGVTATDSVNLKKPSIKCKLMPDSSYPGNITKLHKTIRFTATQTHEGG